ncbi:MarR family winged helix-turn-helix transcriptional regulator [Amycolatopsis keratiniphila]|uniref:MarR family transcriptional regulator n=1 Tax=Amycolatopsis keratiniphila subsp. keratiniphila TaxID=227715 RepID=A0A1W2LKJ8_9PSEU|nr:MarR family winged helix-turn-helix transcriptional regulator [Amycolatopsis keratiniphila]OLZ52784.1 MarR family transcriptional regulator [Amycolatopsis keratiniphila subsp. nogabecina]ONF63393.1 MarR family transcriptional regulator [Amycolatopsis keratiniphila subsp. keratiniphila]SDU08756.1 DNA-binding transcriptional regulator, MarR family [Amycolatopsis keratiniphila]
MGESARTSRLRGDTPVVTPAPPSDLLAAPGYGARRLYQAYLAAWNRHVDPVLTGPQFAVLSAVRAYPGSDQSSLAGAVALDTSTMADLCRRLERRGLIRRVESPHDARRKLLSLTDEGKSVLSQVNRRARRLDKALLDGDDDIDMAALLNALGARWERIAEIDKLR